MNFSAYISYLQPKKMNKMNKLSFIFLITILMAYSSNVYPQCEAQVVVFLEPFYQCDDNPWVLVFEDDFNDNSLDLSIWYPIYGVPRDLDFENQKAWHKPENLVVENGLLKIISKDEPQYNMPVVISWDPFIVKYEDFDYTTGELWTKRSFLNGIFEARIKIPKGKGLWPAFWLFGGNVWNELDIFEFWNEYDIWGNFDPNKLSRVHHMNVWFDHNNDGKGDDCPTKYTGSDFSQQFHIFAVKWEKNKIEWYVDGILKRTDYRYYTVLGQSVGCMIYSWTQYLKNKIYPIEPMSLILNTAIQTGQNSPDQSTMFPKQMEIDWVRIYQRNQCKDVNVTHASQFPLDDQLFNVIVGENVSITCNYEIPSRQQLDIVAKDGIILGAGFHAQAGSTFKSRTESTVCGSSLHSKSTIDNNQQEFFTSDLVQTDTEFSDMTLSYDDIQIMPNPNEGIFQVDFGSLDHRIFKIMIRDLEGRIIKSIEDVNSSTMTIDLSGYQKGLYILFLIDYQNETITTFKIVLQ